MKKYIWQNPEYPNFTYDKEHILSILNEVKLKQGFLQGKISQLGFEIENETNFKVLTKNIIKSSEIEGQILNIEQIRSSLAKRLGIKLENKVTSTRDIEGLVEVMLDATQNYDKRMTKERICGWQSAMFPNSYSSLYKITTGEYRNDKNGPMQVVSGAIGHEKIHYEAPPASVINSQMEQLFEFINNDDKTDLVLKAGIIHLWFVIIHPFEDGNGRIARALSDMLLSKSEKSKNRFYSVSAEINKDKKSYYKNLELTQKNSLDITSWLEWFLNILIKAMNDSENLFYDVINKTSFWNTNREKALNERQTKMLNRLLDNFEGKLTTSKWAKICNCSQDTATRDIQDLISKNILIKLGEARATHYELKNS